MQLTIFQYCQERQCDRNEFPIRLAWADAPPALGQAVSMGRGDAPHAAGNRRWQVVQVYTFTPATATAITAVHLALIALPGDPSDQADWDCWSHRHRVPQENIYVHLEAVGLPELGIGFNCLNQPPTLGQPLFAATPTGQGSQLSPQLRPWQIGRYDHYTPTQEGCPYTGVYLNWCEAISRELAPA